MSDVSDLRYGVHSLSREIRAHRRPGALTETQYLVLGSLDRGGPATPAELGRRTTSARRPSPPRSTPSPMPAWCAAAGTRRTVAGSTSS